MFCVPDNRHIQVDEGCPLCRGHVRAVPSEHNHVKLLGVLKVLDLDPAKVG
jgi:hypothetical protein